METVMDKKETSSQEASDLLMYLVRPLKEIEKKIEQQEKSLQSRIRNNIEQMDKCADEIARIDGKLSSLEVEPRKHESRIGAVEGKAQHVEPLLKEVRLLKESVSKLQERCECIEEHSSDLRMLKRSHLDTEKRMASHDINHRKKEEAIAKDCEKLQQEFLKSKEEIFKRIENLRTASFQMLRELKEKFSKELKVVPSFQGKVEDVGRKFESCFAQFEEKLNNSYHDLLNKYDSLKQNLTYTSDNMLQTVKDVKFKVEKEEHNYENFQQQIEILEMRCEKMMTMIKKLQVEKE